ncbi:hypothetical protein AB4Y96_01740 [Phyllobacterium sp. TAF24]|uniref:hypothetical protein n=1 Tax=unclassified Phyllobacterium TaxID=2638441 RepID=UPI00088DD3A2|nr:hypothetical protein [Phyllobacterium sp. OV277]SDP55798.1 hypothetical protein SAMN05443582_1067 [Phyllobacterium sp. OV277]
MSKFPYGNDLNNPDSWAGFANTKSESWMIGYHSGMSLGIGAHTFLFFGRENLVAFSASLIGGGLTAQFGLSNAAKKLERGGGKSTKLPSEMLERIEKAKDVNDAYNWSTSLEDIKSAHHIYKLLASNVSTFNALTPFSSNDLGGTMGVVSGVAVDVLIGGASYYLADARNLFKEATAFNITNDATLVSASLGSLWGVWRVEKFFSLWAELAYSKKEEYPFQTYNVHPFFQQWKSKEYAYEKQLERLQQQDRIINNITEDMIANPQKYGYPDSQYALQRVVEMNKQFYDGARSATTNPYLPWVPFDQQHLFK